MKEMRRAAVLVGVSRGRWPWVLLTERSGSLRTHPGQISFPGGGLQPSDAGDPVRAALRECGEEVGVSRSDVEVVGLLPACEVRQSNHWVVPVLARLSRGVRLRPDPGEVAAILRVPLGQVFQPERRLEHRYDGGSRVAFRVRSLEFHHGWRLERFVWGASATILDSLRVAGVWGRDGVEGCRGLWWPG